MVKYEQVVIVGVGLLGGSLGLALRNRQLARRVVGVGRSPSRLEQAIQLGAVDDGTPDLKSAVATADLVVMCSPVQSIIGSLEDCLSSTRALVTDVGSTKVSICERASEILGAASTSQMGRFVGSHPLAGSEKVGVQNASGDLFVDRTCVLTPLPETPAADVDELRLFWEAVGSRVLQLSPAEHDKSIACTSHLPHILASALAGTTPDELLPLAASGWLDTTRIAGGNPQMWQEIIAENREAISAALQSYSDELTRWLAAIDAGDDQSIHQMLVQGKEQRDSVGS
ncbi:MAG TPA: prephenate dehydrogenase/arogenate dehydrogenase family protein [Planctomycetaceae bacterium]|nr:prephenate dehydrogenase/arogenate dehydrogenase family protein [Planctomycetaceae bacterium]